MSIKFGGSPNEPRYPHRVNAAHLNLQRLIALLDIRLDEGAAAALEAEIPGSVAWGTPPAAEEPEDENVQVVEMDEDEGAEKIDEAFAEVRMFSDDAVALEYIRGLEYDSLSGKAVADLMDAAVLAGASQEVRDALARLALGDETTGEEARADTGTVEVDEDGEEAES